MTLHIRSNLENQRYAIRCGAVAARFAGILLVAVCLGDNALVQAQQKKKGRPALVDYTPALSRVIGASVELPGSVVSLRKAQVATPVEGLVAELVVREGEAIKKGQLVAQLDTANLKARQATLEAQLTEAEARLLAAESNFRRAEELFEGKLISTEELDTTRFERQALEARSRSLKASIAENALEIKQSVIRAPFEGVVTLKRTEVGEWARVGDPIVDLLSLAELEIAVQVPEVHIGNIVMGQAAKAVFPSLGYLEVAAQVVAMVPEADPDSRTFPVRLGVSSAGGGLRPGMLATVTISPPKPRAATIVPKDAIVGRGDQYLVFTLADNNTVQPATVRMGEGIGQWVEVHGRIQPGDNVIIRGNERLQPGQAVNARPLEYPAP